MKNRLRVLRAEREWSQADLALRSGPILVYPMLWLIEGISFPEAKARFR